MSLNQQKQTRIFYSILKQKRILTRSILIQVLNLINAIFFIYSVPIGIDQYYKFRNRLQDYFTIFEANFELSLKCLCSEFPPLYCSPQTDSTEMPTMYLLLGHSGVSCQIAHWFDINQMRICCLVLVLFVRQKSIHQEDLIQFIQCIKPLLHFCQALP